MKSGAHLASPVGGSPAAAADPRPRGEGPAPSPLLDPGRNVWRVARAERAAVLIDAADYFCALRAALIDAERSVLIVGWDIDSRTRLLGPSCTADDGLPETLGPFLDALVERRPELSVRLVLWDFSILYSLERELSPELALQWQTSPQVELCLDDEIPTGSAHHQKIVAIDDRIAFCGGLDLTIRRWDTGSHAVDNPDRVDPAGAPYPPFHDVQMMVDGPAAGALAELAAERWRRLSGETPPPADLPAGGWPAAVVPDLTDVDIGIARTWPQHGEEREVREVEALYHDLIGAAQRWIYIENQFLTAAGIAERLAAALTAKPELEAVLVVPRTHHTWLEEKTMLAGRIRFRAILEGAGVMDRVRLVYPGLDGGEDAAVFVHAKVAIVDDRYLRVGSANLAERSMGADTECDLVAEARTREQRAGITAVLGRFLSEHCGCPPEAVAATLAEHGLCGVVDRLSRGRRGLRPVEDPADAVLEKSSLEMVADPSRPLGEVEPLSAVAGATPGPSYLRWLVPAAVVVAVFAAATLAWRYTGLAAFADVETIAASLDAAPDGPASAALVVAAFVLGGLVAFPVTILIAATAVAFGVWPGLAFAATGSLASAVSTYLIGRMIGQERLRRRLGPRINRLGEKIARQGIVTVATVRLVPIAPFTVVNLVAGALRIRVLDYIVGTMLGLAPGLVLMTTLGGRILAVFENPSAGTILLLVGVIIGWILLSIGLQVLVTRWQGRNA